MSVNVGSAVGYLDLDIDGFLNGLKTAQTQADERAGKIQRSLSGKMKTAGDKFQKTGKSLTTGITLPVIGVGTAAVTVGAKFETAMSKVKAISGATSEEMEVLTDKAREMGAKTKFSATESADAFRYMAMAGWDAKDMVDGIDGIMNLAAADGLDLATTSDIVTDAITAFGLESKDAGHFADVLAKTSSNANTDVAMLGESFKFVAPVAGAFGYSVEDTATMLGLMANSGIKAGQAGTTLRGALSRLADPSDEAAALMDKYAISLTDAEGNMRSLDDLMAILKSELGGLSEEQQIQAASTLFGKEAMSGMLAIINSSEEDYNKLSSAIGNADGAAKDMADTMLDNLNGQLTIIKSSLEELALQISDILMPYIEKFASKIQKLVDKFKSMSKEQKESILKMAGFAAAIGPVLMVVGTLSKSVGKVIDLFARIPGISKKLAAVAPKMKAALMGPVGAIIAAVVILGAAFKNLWDRSEEFRENIMNSINRIKTAFSDFSQGIVDRVNDLGYDFENLSEIIKSVWEGFTDLLAPIFETAFDVLASVIEGILGVLTGLFDVFTGIFTGDWDKFWTGITEIFQSLVDGWKKILGKVLEMLGKIIVKVGKWIAEKWKEIWQKIKDKFVEIWESIIKWFKDSIEKIKTTFSDFVKSVVDFFKELPSNISKFLSDTFERISKWGKDTTDKAVETGSNFLNNIVEFFSELPYKVGHFIGEVIAKVYLWSTDMVSKAKETGKNFIDSVIEFFANLPSNIAEFLDKSFTKAKDWSKDMIDKAKETGKNFLDSLIDFFINLPGKIKEFLDSAIENTKLWAEDMVTKAKEMATNFINSVIDKLVELPGVVKEKFDLAVRKAADWVSDMAKKGKESIEALIEAFIEGAKEIPEKMAEIGVNMVKGVWEGIQSMVGWFTSKVEDFFEGIVDGVKDALDINSPSKVMADEVGRWMPMGIAMGFEKAMPKAASEMSKQLRKGLQGLDANDSSIGVGANIDDFSDSMSKSILRVSDMFDYLNEKIERTSVLLAEASGGIGSIASQVSLNSGGVGYVGYNSFQASKNNQSEVKSVDGKNGKESSDTFVFHSPKPIDEVEAARLMRKTKRDMSEGF